MTNRETLLVRFESPADDPLKVPRPLILEATINEVGTVTHFHTKGGEVGPGHLFGLVAADYDVPDDPSDADQFISGDLLIEEALELARPFADAPADRLGMRFETNRWQGWKPALIQADTGSVQTVMMPVSVVVVEPK